MSGYILIRRDDGITAFSDGGRYRESDDFTLMGVASKPAVLTHISSMICSVGSQLVPTLLRYGRERLWLSFDDLIEDVPAGLRMALSEAQRLDPREIIQSQLAIGGYSIQRARWESYTIKGHATAKEVSVSDLEPAPTATFFPEPDGGALGRYGFDPDRLAFEDLTDAPLRFMRAMRATPQPMGRMGDDLETAQDGHTIGGFIERVILARDVALSQVIWRWPDEVGELIDPTNEGGPAAETA